MGTLARTIYIKTRHGEFIARTEDIAAPLALTAGLGYLSAQTPKTNPRRQ